MVRTHAVAEFRSLPIVYIARHRGAIGARSQVIYRHNTLPRAGADEIDVDDDDNDDDRVDTQWVRAGDLGRGIAVKYSVASAVQYRQRALHALCTRCRRAFIPRSLPSLTHRRPVSRAMCHGCPFLTWVVILA